MSESKEKSLRQLLADLHAEREATWDPAALKINIDQRRLLEETADRAAFVKTGDAVAPFRLPGIDGGLVDLDLILSQGPAVLIFFRFAGCPACNIALPYYQRHLYPGLRALGATLVAISPQVPERLVEIRDRHDLSFLIASDTGNALARKFGIVFTADDASQRAAIAKGNHLGEVTGTGTWELPMPAVLVIDENRVARFVDVAPDWLKRTEAEVILEAVEALNRANDAQ